MNMAFYQYVGKPIQDTISRIEDLASLIWKNQPPDKYDFILGKIFLQTKRIHDRIQQTTAADILAEIKFYNPSHATWKQDNSSNVKSNIEHDVDGNNNESCVSFKIQQILNYRGVPFFTLL